MMDIRLYLGLTLLGTFVQFSYGCSPEAWVEPTLESKSHYAKIIAIGTVTRIITEDPAGSLGDTYGAEVTIQCTYKGGVLGDRITIAGAGFIQGMCDSKDLEANKKYILFLDNKTEGRAYYFQSGAAEPYYRDRDLVQICDLQMRYPQENGITLKRKVCLEETTSPTCKRYVEKQIVSGRQMVVETGQLAGELPGNETTTTPGNSATSVMACFSLLVASFVMNFF